MPSFSETRHPGSDSLRRVSHAVARRTGALFAIVLPVLAAGCSERAVESVTEPRYDLVMSSQQLMAWVLEPAADVIWDSAGTIITAEGRQELAPTTDEGWEDVVRASALLVEAGNLMMLPGRAAGDDWIEYSQALIGTGRLAMDAARAQDPEALFDAGGRVYQVCRACHNQYWIREEQGH